MIQLCNISKSFVTQELFCDINFLLGSHHRVGLVGRNGSGKTTLFKLILGQESADDGEILIPKHYKIGALEQHISFSQKTLRAEASLALEAHMQYDVYLVEKILFGLGFGAEDLDKNPLSFSGGYQIRINLAKLLVAQPNLLLLDEPTNYLDIVSMRWLQNFLVNFDGEIILITHDRDFMDSVCTHTMGIVHNSLSYVAGNTHKFYAQLRADEELYEKQKISQDRKIKELEGFIAKNRVRASTAAIAQSKIKQLEKIEKINDLVFDSTLDFDFVYKNTSAKVLLEVEDLSFGYTPSNLLFENISFVLKPGECLGIIGKNGKGKSTLLNTIAGELTQLGGNVSFHNSASFAHFGQTNISHLDQQKTVFEEIYQSATTLSNSGARNICGAMMFAGESADKKISLLSGGEKSRVMLGKILAKEVNVLLLDEPTNHLDFHSIDALTQAIINFKGAVIIVTHSQELLRKVADRLIIFSATGASYFDRGYDEFLEKIGWEEESETKEKKVQKSDRYLNKKERAALLQERNSLTKPFSKEIEKLEKFITKTEVALKCNQDELIALSSGNESAKIIDLYKVIAQQESAIESAFDELEIAHESYEELMASYEQKLEALSK